MTPKERAAMQQALEALENYGIDGTKSVGGIKCTEAITALREALAGDILSPTEQAEQEPVAKFLEDNLVVENERVDKSGHRVLEIREEELLRIMEIYAAPVRTKDLTDDDIFKTNKTELPDCQDLVDFARAVIAAYKEKNK